VSRQAGDASLDLSDIEGGFDGKSAQERL